MASEEIKMTQDEKTILLALAQDVGYIRGAIEPLKNANIPDRLTALETVQRQHGQDIEEIQTKGARRVALAIAAVAAVGALGSLIIAAIAFSLTGGS